MQSRERFTVAEIANEIAMPLEQCRTFINKLLQKGSLLIVAGIGVHTRPYQYQVVEGTRPRVGKGNSGAMKHQTAVGQQMIWNSIRILRSFNNADVQMTTGISIKSINSYIRSLERAGYLKRFRVDKTLANALRAGKRDRLRLVPFFQTGPRAPIIRRNEGVWDQNLQKLYPFMSI